MGKSAQERLLIISWAMLPPEHTQSPDFILVFNWNFRPQFAVG
jgi:hypothetical protein